MRYRSLSLVFVMGTMFTNDLLTQSKRAPVSYILKLQRASCDLPLCMLYQGKRISCTANMGVITSDAPSASFSIVITPEVAMARSKHGGAPRLVRVNHAPIRWFDCALKMAQHGEWRWDIIERDDDEMPSYFPDHALIIMLHPRCVLDVVNPSRVKYCSDRLHIDGACTFELPAIRCDAGCSARELYAACAAGECAFLAVRHTHTIAAKKQSCVNGVWCSHDI